MEPRTDYEFWTIESIDRLVAANTKLHTATTAAERREALRLIDIAHQEAVDLAEQRDTATPRSVRHSPQASTDPSNPRPRRTATDTPVDEADSRWPATRRWSVGSRLVFGGLSYWLIA